MKNSFASWLRTQNAGIGFFLLALVTQLNHAQDVAMGISKHKWLDGLSSWGFACSLESAVLFAVMNKRHKFSYAFALISVGINVAYYESGLQEGKSMFFFDTQFAEHWSKWLVSIVLPFAIAFYSHTIAKTGDEVSWNWNVDLQNWWRGLFGANDPTPDLQPDLQPANESLLILDPQTTDYENVPAKFKPIFELLHTGPKTRAELATHTKIPQSTLFRANGGNPTGYLVDMQNLHLITHRKEGTQLVYTLNGVSK